MKVVNVLATVRNKSGALVGNLEKDDFALAEDGHPQSIRYFLHETDLPLTLGLMVDTSGSQDEGARPGSAAPACAFSIACSARTKTTSSSCSSIPACRYDSR
ncbi:MAG: hypothetical protein WDO73_17550 [Ignavibacteriota bacterium]